MATGTTSTFGNFKIEVGDGATPTEAFTFICGLTSRGINMASDVTTSEVPDCSNEDLPSWQEKDVKSLSATLSGSGMWTREAHETLFQWWFTGAKKNVKVSWMNAATGDVKTLTGPCVLTQLGETVAKGERLSAEISLEFSAKPTTTDAT